MVFRRAPAKQSNSQATPGVKPSIFNRCSLISSGLESLDAALGGGFALGSVACIFEDYPSCWHSVLFRHYLVQGVMSSHKVCMFAQDSSILERLPSLLEPPPSSSQQESKDMDEELRIAWRYKASLQQQASSASSNSDSHAQYSHRFDMSRNAGDDISRAIETVFVDCDQSRISIIQHVTRVLREIEGKPEKDGSSVARIAFQSFGSFGWMGLQGVSEGASSGLEFLEMLHTIKGLVRGRRASVVFTIPGLFLDSDIGHRMLRVFDFATSVRSGSMMGDTWRQHYEGYEGLLHVLKLPRLNSLLTPPQPMSSSYLIKVHRRRLVLDPLHTPPEQGGGTNQERKAASVEF